VRTLLVTGAGGFLGWNICATARESWRVVGVMREQRAAVPDVTAVACDLTRFADLTALFREVRPDAVIHAAAMAQPEACQRDSQGSRRINVDATLELAGLAAEASIPLVFISSDLVFDGRRAPYREEDPVAPVSVYGGQKVAAERGVRDRHPGATICRLPLMFGEAGPVAGSCLQGMLAAFASDRDLALFVDEVRTPVSGRTAAAGILLALDTRAGILHLGGRARISRYAFGALVAELLGESQARIQPVRQVEVATLAPRPPDVSLDSSRAYALGYDPPTLREDLRRALVALGHLPPA
jgi:dTDP-4-dehydrorhamnose reductase